MDGFLVYIVAIYLAVFPLSVWGAFSARFDANILQQLAMCLFALWAVWRVTLIVEGGWGYPHEPVVATALAIYAAGTIQKALKHKQREKCRE